MNTCLKSKQHCWQRRTSMKPTRTMRPGRRMSSRGRGKGCVMNLQSKAKANGLISFGNLSKVERQLHGRGTKRSRIDLECRSEQCVHGFRACVSGIAIHCAPKSRTQ